MADAVTAFQTKERTLLFAWSSSYFRKLYPSVFQLVLDLGDVHRIRIRWQRALGLAPQGPILVRGNEITVTGRPEETALVSGLFEEMLELQANGAELSADAVERAVAHPAPISHGVIRT